jgi:thiosulfate/3-mercaptopyruvate sulfurtransferase
MTAHSTIDTQPGANLVTTDWLTEHLEDPSIRIIESNEDTLLFRTGHIPGAIEVDWIRDLNDPIRRDYLDKKRFRELASLSGITDDTEVVFYGDRNNWWACFALWIFVLHGHTKVKILDGGRMKWELENRPLVRTVANYTSTDYQLGTSQESKIRAFRDEVLEAVSTSTQLIDVRSAEEFSGERLHMPEYPNEGALRGGHIPGARHIPWAKAVDAETGAFLSIEKLEKLYLQENKLDRQTPTIAYCRIGERSSHTWFVLTHLLGFSDVRNYDGSWSEWGNLVGVPIEK